jgi:E3 ubiquitin-protein ligase BRE1
MLPADEDESMGLNSCSSLFSADQELFQKHLREWSTDIRSVIARLQNGQNTYTPEVSRLQTRLSQLLAAQKECLVKIDGLETEVEELNERLENAASRYMMAEKKLDRAKSATVAKLEKQALMGAQKSGDEDGGPVKREDSTPNGVADNSETVQELEDQLSKSTAVSDKQKDQLEQLSKENAALIEKLTAATTKASEVTDDDFAKTELFKQHRMQHEEVLKRVNNLEALNIQLQEEAVKLQSERTAYKSQLEQEMRSAVSEKDAQLSASDGTLARIRSHRDELLADIAIKKAVLDNEWDSLKKLKEFTSAQEERIQALESENERLTMESGNLMLDASELDSLTSEDLRTKYAELKHTYDLLNNELSSMSSAFQKSSKLASQKVSESITQEEARLRLSAEKAKADQKYFAAMKSKETREGEIRTLRMQNTKSSEMVSTLKEAELASRALLTNLEKQLAEAKDMLSTKINDHKLCQQKIVGHGNELNQLNGQIAELKKALKDKDTSYAAMASSCRAAEQEVEELKASLKSSKRSEDAWKVKGLSGNTEQYENMRVSLFFVSSPSQHMLMITV